MVILEGDIFLIEIMNPLFIEFKENLYHLN
jgi:hypothetical protein